MQFSRVGAGDRVGVVAPAGAVDGSRLEAGLATLEGLGFQPRRGASLLARDRYLAGHDDARRADLQAALDDPAIRAVICARGGYGSQRIVGALDLTALARDPKPVVGYSDITALLATIVREGLVAVHGPMVATDLARGLDSEALSHFTSLLGDPSYAWSLEVPLGLRPGRARGRLVGGCLSVIVHLLGTPFAPDTDGAILFLEDTNEWPYRIDRMLTHARQAGLFERVAGVVFGTFETCRPFDGVSALDVVRDCFADAPFPVGWGLAAGHRSAESDVRQMALPLGVDVALDVDRGTLTALQPAAGARS